MASSVRYSFLVLLQLLLLLLTVIPYASPHDTQSTPVLSTLDFNALLSIKTSLSDLPGSSFFSSWDFSAPDPCSSFTGVTCSPDSPQLLRVTALFLGTGLAGSLGLAGTLPASLVLFSELTQLILNPGLVTGPIPPQLGQLANLRVLSLSHNRLSGPVPPSLSAIADLHTLDLSFNLLTGDIPASILTNLTSLKILTLAGNQLTGELPTIGESTQLLHLDLKSNQLVGPIRPDSLPLSLRYVALSQNQMWGPINGLDSLSELVYLDLSVNRFSGPLPLSLLRPSLSSLLLRRNNFSGDITFPSSTSDPYPEGSIIDLSHNAFSGELPEAAAGAESVFLNNNKFTGAVPEIYVAGLAQGTIKMLYLQHNFLDRFTKSSPPPFPEEAEVCLAYNCMVPPSGLGPCPAGAGVQISRPATQCSVFHNN